MLVNEHVGKRDYIVIRQQTPCEASEFGPKMAWAVKGRNQTLQGYTSPIYSPMSPNA
jgi:hypothetical protein